jgi:2-methylcitrate dehydratase
MRPNSIASSIADFALGLKFSDLPGEVVHEAKRRVIDSIACMLGAYDSAPARIAMQVAPRIKGKASATILGTSIKTTPEHAAFANGVMLRYLDFNDTYLSKEPAHPSDNIPALLACAEASRSSGKDLLTAIVAAYEIQCALCDSACLRVRGIDHVAYGAFSATASAARLMGLSRDESINAVGIAGVNSPALRQTRSGEVSMWKACAFAKVARDAVFFSLLARDGLTGPGPVFEGEFGFFNVISGEFQIRLPEACAKDPSVFKTLGTYIKYRPAEYHGQTAIEAAMQAGEDIQDTRDIAAITVTTYRTAFEIIGKGQEKRRPATRETADHSIFYLVASALALRDVSLEAFSGERLNDPHMLSLIDKTTLEVDEGLDKLYPSAFPTRVEVRLCGGRVVSREVMYPKGHPKNPLTDLEVEDKFRRLSAWYLPEGSATKALKALWAIEDIKDAGRVLAPFTPLSRKRHA